MERHAPAAKSFAAFVELLRSCGMTRCGTFNPCSSLQSI